MITRESFVIVLGVFLLFIPALGVPTVWKTWGIIGIGFLLILIGYSLRHTAFLRSIERDNGERATDSFVESVGAEPAERVE